MNKISTAGIILIICAFIGKLIKDLKNQKKSWNNMMFNSILTIARCVCNVRMRNDNELYTCVTVLNNCSESIYDISTSDFIPPKESYNFDKNINDPTNEKQAIDCTERLLQYFYIRMLLNTTTYITIKDLIQQITYRYHILKNFHNEKLNMLLGILCYFFNKSAPLTNIMTKKMINNWLLKIDIITNEKQIINYVKNLLQYLFMRVLLTDERITIKRFVENMQIQSAILNNNRLWVFLLSFKRQFSDEINTIITADEVLSLMQDIIKSEDPILTTSDVKLADVINRFLYYFFSYVLKNTKIKDFIPQLIKIYKITTNDQDNNSRNENCTFYQDISFFQEKFSDNNLDKTICDQTIGTIMTEEDFTRWIEDILRATVYKNVEEQRLLMKGILRCCNLQQMREAFTNKPISKQDNVTIKCGVQKLLNHIRSKHNITISKKETIDQLLTRINKFSLNPSFIINTQEQFNNIFKMESLKFQTLDLNSSLEQVLEVLDTKNYHYNDFQDSLNRPRISIDDAISYLLLHLKFSAEMKISYARHKKLLL